MLAFLTRRKDKDATMTDTTAPEHKTQTIDNNTVMQFLTQGGATVELHRQNRTVRTIPGASTRLLPDGETRVSNGFNWRCLGCDVIGGGSGYGDHHFDSHQLGEARGEANQHATGCRAMPKPTTVRRHQIAMDAAKAAHYNARLFEEPTTEDVINLAYGNHGIRLTETEARDALAAQLAQYGRRLNTPAA